MSATTSAFQGWGRALGSRVLHWFRFDGLTLCRRYTSPCGRLTRAPKNHPDHMPSCQACLLRRRKERA